MKEHLGVGKSHSKIILMGEHAVVYGYPAIALPLTDINVTCQIKPAYQSVPQAENSLARAIALAKDYLGKTECQLRYELVSQVPEKRGMGSSAAVSLAGIRAVFDYFQEELPDHVLSNLANQAEKIAHSNPSGLDVKTCMSHQAIKFIKNQGFEPLSIDLDAYLVIADTGIHGHTSEAVQKIADLGKKASPYLEQLGDLTLTAEKAIKAKELEKLGHSMTKAHKQLAQLGVSCEVADHLVEKALAYGSLGAKMSGGGLGGCVIALIKNKTNAQKLSQYLKKEGACQTWIRNL
ncbi:mevalonate kinase [Streptococcus sp. sy010]|uniref:mevalonate kinase n=1 Tax=Streptococcus sp. sy010 TaxID=2600148 RepID=UPI0011B6A27E|nr:mevalonate kinase [Streptococcus sp. sy010]TWT16662.1 mevalonate kinase [Streptococcus sp. sy010]